MCDKKHKENAHTTYNCITYKKFVRGASDKHPWQMPGNFMGITIERGECVPE